MKYCENCGAELEDSAVFCEECGAKVETVPQEKAVDSEQGKEIDRPDNEVIESKEEKHVEIHSSIETEISDKSNGKKKMMIPVLCGAIAVLVIAVIVTIVVISKKSDNDGKNKGDETIISTENVTDSDNWKKLYIECLKNVDSKNYSGCEYIYLNNDDIPELLILGSNTAAGNILVTSDNTTINTKIVSSGNMYYAEKINELDVESGRQGVYVYKIYSIIDGQIKEDEVNSYNTSGKKKLVYNRPKTIQQVIDYLSGKTTATEATTQTTKKLTATEKLTGTWLAQEEQKPGDYTFKVSLEMTVNSVDGSNANVDLKFVRTSERGITFIYLIKGLNANIVSGTGLEFDASKADLVLSNESNREETILNPFRGKTFGTGTIQIDTTDNDSIGITILNVNFVNDNFSLMNVDMKRQ